MRSLDLADIQGGILRAYGRQGFPKARYFFLHVTHAAKGRRFIEALRPRITSAARWTNPKRGEPLLRTRHPRLNDIVRAEGKPDYPGEVELEKPKVAINIAFTFYGLLALEVPTRTLRGMPDEFIDGMEKRASVLGDTDFLAGRDAIWRNSTGDGRVHIMVSMNAEMDADGQPVQALQDETTWLTKLCEASDHAVVLLGGVGPGGARWQDASAVLRDGENGAKAATNKEHFGLSDGFGDPVFEGQLNGPFEAIKVVGGGKILPDRSWAPLATGEFLLGYPDEAQEIAGSAMPIEFSRNGTFMAYRKLHENVDAFVGYMADQGRRYGRVMGIDCPDEALQTVQAKMVGRWADGVPLMAAPTYAEWKTFNQVLHDAQGGCLPDEARPGRDRAEIRGFHLSE